MSYGRTYDLVEDAWRKGRFSARAFLPIVGGLAFSVATITLRKIPRVQHTLQAGIAIGIIALSNVQATAALVNEKASRPYDHNSWTERRQLD